MHMPRAPFHAFGKVSLDKDSSVARLTTRQMSNDVLSIGSRSGAYVGVVVGFKAISCSET